VCHNPNLALKFNFAINLYRQLVLYQDSSNFPDTCRRTGRGVDGLDARLPSQAGRDYLDK
jgi:hypothetical protein